jgi:hypothetical protein
MMDYLLKKAIPILPLKDSFLSQCIIFGMKNGVKSIVSILSISRQG